VGKNKLISDFAKALSDEKEIKMLNFLNKNQSSAKVGGEAEMTQKKAGAPGFQKVINVCLYLLAFLMPVLFLTFTTETREFNKQALLFLAVVIMLVVWVFKILTTRKVSWVKTSLDFVLLVYLLVYLISSFVSLDKTSSFLGYYGRFTGSFISVIGLIVLYFLIVNNIRGVKVLNRFMNFLLAGMGLSLAYSMLQLFGWYILRIPSLMSNSFNSVGSLVGLGIFAALTIIYIQWMMLTQTDRSKLKSVLLWVLTVVGLIVLLIVNAFVAWLVLGLAMVAFLALSMTLLGERQTSSAWFWKPMLVLVISILFVSFQFLPAVLNPRNLITVNLPVEIQLSNGATWNLVKNSMGSGVKQAILGSGPGTTGIAFGEIKPQDLNKTIVWSLTFDRASSEIANIGIETGIMGLLAFELTAILFLIYALFYLLKKGDKHGYNQAFGFFMLWLTLYVAHFFYFFNTTFFFIYWISIACFMAIAHWKTEDAGGQELSFSNSPRSALSWMFASLLVLAALLVGGFFQAAVYGGEVAYAQGIKELNKSNPDFNKVSNSFGRAITLDPYRDVYYLAYGQNLIFLGSQEAAKKDPDTAKIQSWISDLIAAGKKATEISPGKASNWSALAQFYNGIRPIVGGTDDYIISAWTQAIQRDEKNPSLYVQLGLAYMTAAQTTGSDGKPKLDDAMMKKAETAFTTAIEIKPDLPDPYLALARAFETQGNTTDAKKQLDKAAVLFPTNPDVLFEQGRLTYNNKDYDQATKIFNNVLVLVPNHVNALYSLGLIALQKGDKQTALTYFEKVRELNGPNVDLEKQINDLKASMQVPVTK